MTKTQTQQVTVLVLLVVFAVVWTMTRRASRPAVPAATTTAGSQIPASVTEPAGPLAPAQPELAEALSPTRDLFAPPRQLLEAIGRKEELAKQEEERLAREKLQEPPEAPRAPVVLPPLELQGILWGPRRQAQAIINRQILKVGQGIEGAQIVAITQEGVKVLYGDQEFLLKMPAGLEKKGGEE